MSIIKKVEWEYEMTQGEMLITKLGNINLITDICLLSKKGKGDSAKLSSDIQT